MANSQKLKGRLFKRGKKGNYYLEYYRPQFSEHGKRKPGKRTVERLLDEDGKPITNKATAEAAREKLLAPYRARNEAELRNQVFQQYRTAEENARALEIAQAEEAKRKNRITIGDAWDKYLSSPKRPDTGDATLQQYTFQWGQFVKWHAENYPDHPRLIDVDAQEAEAYATDLQRRGLSPSTYNKHIGLLRLVFRILGPSEDMHANPFDGVTRKKNRQKRANRRAELSHDQLHKLFDEAAGELKTLLFLGLYTGQRLGDCCTLQWANVDLSRRVIILTPSKTASTVEDPEPLRIPIHPVLHTILDDTPQARRQGDILPELAAKYRHDRTRVTDRVMALFRKVGINPYKEGTGYVTKANPKTGEEERVYTGKRAVVRYGFHSLRHSAVSFLQEAGIAFAVVQKLVGHNSSAMTDHYTHVGDEALKTAIAALPSVTETQDSEETELRNRLAGLARTLSIETVRELVEAAQSSE